LPKM